MQQIDSTIKVMTNKTCKKNKTWKRKRRKQKRRDEWEHRRGTEEANC